MEIIKQLISMTNICNWELAEKVGERARKGTKSESKWANEPKGGRERDKREMERRKRVSNKAIKSDLIAL